MSDERRDHEIRGREALDALYWRSEILQVLFWMRGEGLGDEVPAEQVATFLAVDRGEVARWMERLAASGYLEAAGGGRYRLLPAGVEEGARAFQDEFADVLGRRGHGECGPGCWCRDPRRAGEPCPGGLDGVGAGQEGGRS